MPAGKLIDIGNAGPNAFRKLVEYLKVEKGIERFMIRPSEKNTRAIRAYEKAGFKRVHDMKGTDEAYLLPEFYDVYGDYGLQNTAVLVVE